MAHPPSDTEWAYWSKFYPGLQRPNLTILEPKNTKYNCISWSLGFTDRWIDVGKSKTGLATLYAHYYYIGCGTETAAIDVYAVGEAPKHAAKLENATTCTSKMQALELLRHHRQELEDNGPKASYGMIYGHFMKDEKHPGNADPKLPKADHPNNHEQPTPLPVGQPEGKPPVEPIHPQPPTTLHPTPAPGHAGPASTHGAPATAHPPPESAHAAPAATHPSATTHPAPATHPSAAGHAGKPGVTRKALSPMGPYDPIPPPAEATLSTVHNLHQSLRKSYSPAATNFENLFAAWKATWFSPEMEHEANSSARAKGPEFEALVKLGPAIIPLVVQKLADPDNCFAIQLYNALEKDEGVKVDPNNVLDHNVLQRHANLILDMNHQRNEAFTSKAAEWQEHQEQNALSANSTDYVSGDAYKSMVQMGPSVIGHVMDKYANEPDGWWHEMLHEIVHGKPSGAGTFFKDRLYADWKTWFENGQPHDAAPKNT